MKNLIATFVSRGLLLASFLLALTGFLKPLAAQQTYGAINGTVIDPTGALISGATITATSQATGIQVGAISDSAGAFIISNLQPGIYDLSTTATGFADYHQAGVHVEVGLTTNIPVSLVVAGQTQTVTVTSDTPVVNTEENVFGTNINQDEIKDLPIALRRWSNFALLTPGAVPDGSFGDVAFRGMGYMFDNNTVDGAANTQGFFAEEVGRTRMAYSNSLLSIQEFQVSTANYSAEYQDAVGAVINSVTKSGTNNIHGDAYYYLRDSTIGGAYTPFATGAVLQPNGTYATVPIKPLDIRDQFGADAGGPIIKSKLFWYFNFDDFRRTFPVTNIPLTPANFFAPISVVAPASCTGAKLIGGSAAAPKDPTGQILDCRGFTQAQANQAIAFLDSETGTSPRVGDQTIFFPKLDWVPTSKDSLTASYNRVRWKSPYGVQTNATTDRSIDSNGNDFVKDDRAIGSWTHIFNASATNMVRFIYSRDFEFENPTPPLAGEPLSSNGFPPGADINACGYGAGGSSLACTFDLGEPYYLNRAQYPNEKRYQGADTFSLSKGRHFLKFGFDIIHTGDELNAYVSGDQFGEYYYNELADYISDYLVAVNHLPNACLSSTNAAIPCYNKDVQTFGPLDFSVPTLETGFFIQDDWHILSRLTLNLGLRWDHEGLPSPILPNPAVPQTTSFPSDKKDFGPRFGFAYDIFGKGTTVLRGGYGVYYGRVSNEQIYDAMTQTGNPGSQLSATIFPTSSSGAPIAGVPNYPTILSTYTTSVGTPNLTYFPSDFRLPGAEEFDVILEHQFGANTAISLSYLGSVGRFLPIGLDTNLNPSTSTINYKIVGGPLAGQTASEPLFAGARPNPAYNQIVEYCTCGISHYNAAVIQLKRRMTAGVQFDASYTYASDTDDVASATGGSGGSAATPNISSDGPVNPFNFKAENGTSNLEVRNRFVGSVVWRPNYFDSSSNIASRYLLNGWAISLTELAETGLPYIETISGNEPTGLGGTLSSGGPTGGTTSTRAYFLGKNVNFLPPSVNTDMRIGREFRLHENLRLELSLEAFNLFNHQNYNTATGAAYTTGGTAAAPTLTYSNSFGNLTAANNGTLLTARQLQLGGKISF
jgi:hypothetical protein